VNIRPFASGRLALDALVAHAVDAATVADLPVVFVAYQQPTIRIIATFSDSDKHINMIGRKDRGVKTPADLKGKRIGVTTGTNAEYVMDRFLQMNSIPRSAVTVISLPPPDTAAALVRGDVDVIFTWQPNIYSAQKQLGTNAAVYPSADAYSQPFNVVILNNYGQRSPAAIEGLLRGLNRAETFIKTNKAESINIVARKLGMDPIDLAQIWDDYSFELNLPERLPSVLAEEGRWARSAGIVTTDAQAPDYSALVDSTFLQRLH
jgi:NitT/TauT family transport system substrate-binding protein